ncbi:MAG: hypothetical protein ACR2RA_11045 [Geminicoccaceae bacterium]
MTSHGTPTYRYGAISRQLQRVAGDHDRHLRQTWVDRVLDILDGDNLIAQAAAGKSNEDGLLFECNVAPMVWDEPRIVYRRQQLENSDVVVELVDHENTIAGRTFKRAQIRVAFST